MKTSATKTFIGSLLAAVAVTAIAPASADVLDDIRERGVLRVGVAELTPFVVRTEEDGLIGYEIDNTARLAADLGVDVEYKEVAFCDLKSAVAGGDVDIIASGYSMTDPRREVLDFSLPYHRTAYHVVVSKEAAEKAAKTADTVKGLNASNFKLAYIIGGVSGDVAVANFPDADLKGYSARSGSFDDVLAGKLDGVVSSDPFYQYVVAADPDRFVVIRQDDPLHMTIEAFAVKKGEDALLDVLNEWVVERDQDGFSEALRKKWFESTEWPVTSPSPIVCQGEQS